MTPAAQTVTLAELSDADLYASLWRAGELSYLLHADQLAVYQQYRAWAAASVVDDESGQFGRAFVCDIARRWGKTFLWLLVCLEDAIRNPGAILTYATAYAKDISDILIPLLALITESAPPELKPTFQITKQGASAGFFFPSDGPAKGSVIKLVGIDKNPDGLRGRASDGVVIGEAAFVDHLTRTVRDVLYPQLQGRPHARIVLESTPSDDPLHDFDELFVPDARIRGAYVMRTIDDNPMLGARERAEFIRAAGGRASSTCRREYYCERVRDETRAVVPELDPVRHVVAFTVPRYADAYVSLDPGMRDLCAAIFGFWDFERAKLCIQACWAERNAGTPTIALELRRIESALWRDIDEPLTSWTGKDFRAAPHLRVSDVEPRLLQDLYAEHGLAFRNVDKSNNGAQAELREVGVNGLRTAFANDQIEIDPSCTRLIEHVMGAMWNANRTDYARSELHGHYDLLDALVYLWRSVNRNRNPNPPMGYGLARSTNHRTVQRPHMTNAAAALNKAYTTRDDRRQRR